MALDEPDDQGGGALPECGTRSQSSSIPIDLPRSPSQNVDEIAKLEHGKMLKVWSRQARCKHQIAQWKANLELELKGAVTALKQAGKDPFELLVRPGVISLDLI